MFAQSPVLRMPPQAAAAAAAATLGAFWRGGEGAAVLEAAAAVPAAALRPEERVRAALERHMRISDEITPQIEVGRPLSLRASPGASGPAVPCLPLLAGGHGRRGAPAERRQQPL